MPPEAIVNRIFDLHQHENRVDYQLVRTRGYPMGSCKAAQPTPCGTRVSDDVHATVGHWDTRGRWNMRRFLLRGLWGDIARVLGTKSPLEEAVRACIRLLIQEVGVMLVDHLNGIAKPLGHARGIARMLL